MNKNLSLAIEKAVGEINTKENLYSEKKSTKYPLSLHTEFQDELLCSIKNTNINIMFIDMK